MKKGFTLIELLVVIAIIAILAAILFPVFAAARDKARQASCNSNSRQIAMAYYQYTMDSAEAFPIENYGGNVCGPDWVDFLQPFIRNAQVFMCPSIIGKVKAPACPNELGRTAYWTNAYLHRFYPRSWPTNRLFSPLKWARMTYPSTTVAFCEGDVSWGHRAWYVNPTNPLYYAWMRINYPNLVKQTDNRHADGGNYPFIDGHTQWLKPNQIKTTAIYDPGDPDIESNGQNQPRNDGSNPWFRP